MNNQTKKISGKIFFLVGFQIALMTTSFIILESFESEQKFDGNSVNISGKNRFLTEMILNAAKDYYIGGKLTGDPISELAIYEKNLQLLKIGGTQMGMTLSPLPEEFHGQWENIHNLYLNYQAKVQSFVKSDSVNDRETKLVEISSLADKLVEQNDILTENLALDAQNSITLQMLLDVSLTGINIGALIIMMKLVYGTLKNRAEQLIKMEKVNDADKKYRSLYEGLPDLCRTVNTDGIITDCNAVYANNLGYSKEEIIGKSIFDFVDKSHFDVMHNMFETWKQTGILVNHELWLKRKNGSIFPTLISTTSLYDKKGKIIEGNSVIIDMTDIYETKKQYNDLYDENPDLLSTINTEGILLNCNKTYATVLGYTKEELIGKYVFDYVADESIETAMASFSSFLVTGKIRDNEIWIKRRDGSIFPSLISANGRFDRHGKLTEGVVTIKDITELYDARKVLIEKEKQFAILEEKAKNNRLIAIGETASRLGHDLRNPLSIIKNIVEILKLKSKNGVHDENIQEKYAKIERAITRMSHQIEDVLDFVRIKPLELDNHSLVEIIKEVCDKITTPDNVKINLPQNDLKIICDSKKLDIVFINIITNAIQSMVDKGEITIKIIADKDNAYISIEDSGPGIADEILPKIFDPLFTTKQTGTGLGLVSCKNIVEQHGGKIWAESEEGKGTIMNITLPITTHISKTTEGSLKN